MPLQIDELVKRDVDEHGYGKQYYRGHGLCDMCWAEGGKESTELVVVVRLSPGSVIDGAVSKFCDNHWTGQSVEQMQLGT